MKVCHKPLQRTCSDDIEGPEICNTHYETSCETSYKSYEVEQDEPICTMEIEKKCEDVTSKSHLKCRSLFAGQYLLGSHPAKIDLNKKLLPKQKTFQDFNIDALGFRKTRNENPPTREIGVTS